MGKGDYLVYKSNCSRLGTLSYTFNFIFRHIGREHLIKDGFRSHA